MTTQDPDADVARAAGEPFTYSNVNERPRGRALVAAGWFLRGIPKVHAQALPYAQAWRRDNLAALAGTGPLWAALGDSLTQGVGASAHDRGWVGQLRASLAAEGHPLRVVNLGVSGARTDDVLAHQLPALETLGVRPALVTLMIGSNDMLRPRYRTGFVGRFEQILHRLPVGSVVTSLPNPSPVARQANAVLERVAGERGLVVAEMRDRRTASWRGRLAADHFHPNDLGYAGIAEVVGDTVRRVLDQR